MIGERRLGRDAVVVVVVHRTIVVGGEIDLLESEQVNRLLLLRNIARFRRGDSHPLRVPDGDRAEEGDGREAGVEAISWWGREDGHGSGWH